MADSRVAWVDGPDTRGTLNIIWSCLSTLGLCVWTAVHPNIQLHPSFWNGLRARVLMMITAVMFPEIIISAAWRQLELSKWLRHRIQEIVKSNKKLTGQNDDDHSVNGQGLSLNEVNSAPETSRMLSGSKIANAETVSYDDRISCEPSDWTDQQTFFAIMGGFAVDATWMSDDGRQIKERRSLSAKGVEYLFLAGAIPKLSSEEVDERSNSDLIAKAIVVLQISWFAIQTIARLVAKLPLSALELHTVVHAICAIIMYAIWKDKPYALDRAMLLEDSRSKTVVALLICKDRLHEIHRRQIVRFERARETYWIGRASGSVDEDTPPPRFPKPAPLGEVLCLFETADLDVAEETLALAEYHTDPVFRSLAPEAYRVYTGITKNYPGTASDLDDSSWSGIRQTAENFILRQVWGSWSKDFGHRMNTSKALHFVFNLGYGSLHLAAWNSPAFPTDIEWLLWQISSIMVASVFAWGLAWIGYWKLVRLSKSVRRGDWDIVFAPTFGWGMIFFAMARCYLLVESLISLRDSPEAMYRQMSWTTGFPHVS